MSGNIVIYYTMITIQHIKWMTTQNSALGQERIKPGCKFCYVDAFLKRFSGKHGSQHAAAEPKPSDDLHFPDGDGTCGAIGDFGIAITLRSLANTTPCERALVANSLFEIARAINETVPADSGNQHQH